MESWRQAFALLASPTSGLPPLDPRPGLRHAASVADDACWVTKDQAQGVSSYPYFILEMLTFCVPGIMVYATCILSGYIRCGRSDTQHHLATAFIDAYLCIVQSYIK